MKIESARILNAAMDDPEFVAALDDACEDLSREWMERGLQESQTKNQDFMEVLRNNTKALVWREVIVTLKQRIVAALR